MIDATTYDKYSAMQTSSGILFSVYHCFHCMKVLDVDKKFYTIQAGVCGRGTSSPLDCDRPRIYFHEACFKEIASKDYMFEDFWK